MLNLNCSTLNSSNCERSLKIKEKGNHIAFPVSIEYRTPSILKEVVTAQSVCLSAELHDNQLRENWEN